MADSRYLPNRQLDIGQILQEAKHRWLRSTEICEILRNYRQFQLTPEPPVRPSAGSLFLFDRKALRYFRKDGHRWRKKNDGKTVREAHEKLKVGSVDALHCYYAHGQDNENFQRRSYWMLDGQLEHIVLVHYREVEEGYKSGLTRATANQSSGLGNANTSSTGSLLRGSSSNFTIQTAKASSLNKVELSGKILTSDCEDPDSGFPKSSRNYYGSLLTGAEFNSSGSSVWSEIQSSSGHLDGMHEQKFFAEQRNGADLITLKLTDARLDAPHRVQDVNGGAVQLQQDHDFLSVQPESRNYPDPQTVVASTSQVENKSKYGTSNNDYLGELKKLDSFGRWMDKEIGVDCDDSLMTSDSGNYWSSLDAENDNKEVSSLSEHMHLNIEAFGPSLSHEQLFSIHDFAPDWTYSEVQTKVLIVGTFLGSKIFSAGTKWGCMFGEVEVSAEVLTDTVIRCQTPSHAPGRVPFYVTCSNRLACSEVREFEYREKALGVTLSLTLKMSEEEELCFQMNLAKLLHLGSERKWLDCSVKECDKCMLRNSILSMRSENKNFWERTLESSMASEVDHRDVLIQNLLMDRLFEWLVCKVHEGSNGPCVLNNEGQGVIHLAAALGYGWAIGPIVIAGVSPNFRDSRGRTGLHWASYFGREEMVTTLVRFGANPGAVEDPTAASYGGLTAADLASSRGHKGIAGFLAEADLTSYSSILAAKENLINPVSATMAGAKDIESAEQFVVPLAEATDEELSLKGSLAAVRKSALAAALIQAAFRSRSFRHRQLMESGNDMSEVSFDLVALGNLNKVQKMSHFEDYLHFAAVKIQQKYRGWKGRKEYLKLRSRIVRFQARVRGHQVRKQYKKVVWSVSIVEKAILRWRRKGAGLRGFRVDEAVNNIIPKIEKIDEYEYLRVGRRQKYAGVEKALARVRSMARDQEARDQYMRMLSNFENLKTGDEAIGANKL